MKWLWLGIFMIGHLCDMVFTTIYIYKGKKVFPDAEDMELNYHKYFFKKFGIIKGAILSSMISFTVLSFCYIFFYDKLAFYLITFVVGLQWGVAYINYQSVLNINDIIKRSQKLRNNKGGLDQNGNKSRGRKSKKSILA